MSNNPQFDFWYAVNNTRVLLTPTSHLETFGATVLNYHLVTELMDTVDKIRVRAGRVRAARPEILTPNASLENLLDGFGEQAQAYAAWLRRHEAELMILRYGFGITKEHVGEEIVTGGLDQVAFQVRDQVAAAADPLAAVLVGVDQPWEVCLVKLMVDVVQSSAPANFRTLRSHGIRSEADYEQLERHREIEADFAAASRDRRRIEPLAGKLKQYGLFEHYEDRFFALVRGAS